jgi:hypothetical protein
MCEIPAGQYAMDFAVFWFFMAGTSVWSANRKGTILNSRVIAISALRGLAIAVALATGIGSFLIVSCR